MKNINFETLKDIIAKINPQSEYWITDASTNLLEINAIDSLNIIEFISILEVKFNITLDLNDIVTNNFISCEALLNLLKNKYDFSTS